MTEETTPVTTDAPAAEVVPEATPEVKLTRKQLATQQLAVKLAVKLAKENSLTELKALAKQHGVQVAGSKQAIAEELAPVMIGVKAGHVDAPKAKAEKAPKAKAEKPAKAPPTPFAVMFAEKSYELVPMDHSETKPYEPKDGEAFDKASGLVLNRFGRPKKFQPMGEVVVNGKTVRKALAHAA